MAKNVFFDGIDYLVDDGPLAPAKEDFKTHFSSTLAGSGATINFGGINYNIDSAKLATTKTDFVTHLGTISGSGRKVKVSNVEYGIDTAKTADAVEEIHAVLRGLMSGGSSDPVVALIPEGAAYTIAATGTTLNAGAEFPATVEEGDVYTFEHYEYTYQTSSLGWAVAINTDVANNSQSDYGQILESINDRPVTSLENTFAVCMMLEVAPVIPASVTNMYNTFCRCSNLKTYAGAPAGTVDGDFSGYVIPEGVTDMDGTFFGCRILTTAPVIPDSVTTMSETFGDCSALKVVPTLPANVTNMWQTFANCSALITVPDIPYGVTNMEGTFYGCTALTTAPVIPASVTNMSNAFFYCMALSGSITINATPTSYSGCLKGTKITEILGDCGNKAAILATK